MDIVDVVGSKSVRLRPAADGEGAGRAWPDERSAVAALTVNLADKGLKEDPSLLEMVVVAPSSQLRSASSLYALCVQALAALSLVRSSPATP
jgi:hypothetical protein